MTFQECLKFALICAGAFFAICTIEVVKGWFSAGSSEGSKCGCACGSDNDPACCDSGRN